MSKLSMLDEVITAVKKCVKCQKYNADEGEIDCRFCWRKGKTAGFSNMSTPWGRDYNLDCHQSGDKS